MSDPIDLNKYVREQGSLTITARELPEDAEHRRSRDLLVTRFLLYAVGGVLLTGLGLVIWGSGVQQNCGSALLTTVIGGAIVYLFKK